MNNWYYLCGLKKSCRNMISGQLRLARIPGNSKWHVN